MAIKDFEISMDQVEKINFNFEYKYLIKIIKDYETFAEELNKYNRLENRIINLSNYRGSMGKIFLFLIQIKFKSYEILKNRSSYK